MKKRKHRKHGLLKLAAAGLFMLAPGYASKRQKAPFIGVNFAHRGLHTEDKRVPENSLEAFRLAAEAGYGIELDVQLSKDGRVVVFHDDTLDRVCGVRGRVDDYKYDELKKMSLCGSSQTVPLFTEVLDVIGGRSPLIVELKTGPRNKELCSKTYDILENYRGEVCIESFNPLIVAWFRFHARDIVRGQLAMPMKEYGRKDASPPLAFALSRGLTNFIARPQFEAYKIGFRPLGIRIAEKLGAMAIGWTSHEAKNEKRRDGVIFEFYKPEKRFK